MAQNGKQKLKLLWLMKLLQEETSEHEGLTMPQIIQRLEEEGISAERKSVYRDFETLRDFGFDVAKLPTSPVSYAWGNRGFSDAQLLLLADAVQSSKFLTEGMSEALLGRIEELAPRDERRRLRKHLHVEGRIKMQNDSVFYNVDAIQEAMAQRRKVVFRYFALDVNKEKAFRHEGGFYSETPVGLVYADGYYYLVVYNDAHAGFATYRVDRMLDISVSDEPATRNEAVATFNVGEYEARTFGMYGGEQVRATFLVDRSIMGPVVDRFGPEVDSVAIDPDHARIRVTVTKSPVLYGWLAQFGSAIRVEAPTSLASAYAEHLAGIVQSYN